MQEIVPGVEPDHVVEAFFSALGMDADTTKVGVCGPIEQAEVGAAQHAEAVQGFVDIRISITQPFRKQVLVVPRQRRTIMRKNHSQSVPPHELRVGQVLHHLSNRPLAWRFRPTKIGSRYFTELALQSRWSLAENIHRVRAAEQPENGGDVGLGLVACCRRWISEH
jgi:hypothetical protein